MRTPSRKKGLIAGGLLLAAVAVALVIVLAGDDGGTTKAEAVPGAPAVEVISPRNGSRQQNRSVVVRVRVSNFQLAPREFGKEPQLGEGSLRFSLNRIPNCVKPGKIAKALNSPTSAGRLIGKSYDYPRYSGPNGVLAEKVGVAGLYSPATRPQIYYEHIPPGFYRLVINLAQNNGAATDGHAVTTFEVLRNPRLKTPPVQDCNGKVSSAEVFN
jgi:hypothetical protein